MEGYFKSQKRTESRNSFESAVKFTKSELIKERIVGVNVLAQLGKPSYEQQDVINPYFELLEGNQTIDLLASILSGIGHTEIDLVPLH